MKRMHFFLWGFFFSLAPGQTQEIPVLQRFTGDYAWSLDSASQKKAPQFMQIRNLKDLEVFKKGLPKTMASTPKMINTQAYEDELTRHPGVDWDRYCLLVVFQDPSREGPVVLKSLQISGKVVKMQAAVWSRAVESREITRGFYTAFLVPKIPGDLVLEWVPSGVSLRWEIRPGSGDKSELYGYWDLEAGKWLVSPQWTQFQVDRDWSGNFLALDARGWGLFNPQGQLILRPYIFDNGPDYFEEGLARWVNPQGKMGFFDQTGRVIVPADYEFAWPFENGKSQVGRKVKFQREGEHQRVIPSEVSAIDCQGRLLGPWVKP